MVKHAFTSYCYWKNFVLYNNTGQKWKSMIQNDMYKQTQFHRNICNYEQGAWLVCLSALNAGL